MKLHQDLRKSWEGKRADLTSKIVGSCLQQLLRSEGSEILTLSTLPCNCSTALANRKKEYEPHLAANRTKTLKDHAWSVMNHYGWSIPLLHQNFHVCSVSQAQGTSYHIKALDICGNHPSPYEIPTHKTIGISVLC